MNKKTWKPYAAIVLILLYGVDIFWLSGFCVYYFGEWGIPMYEGLLAVLALGIVVLFREDVKRAFHGSFWRFVPTAMLGIAMGYLLAETDNMFYNMFFHLINNALPTLLLQLTSSVASEQMESAEAMASTGILLVTVAVYFIYASAGPFLIYAGNYLIHKGQPGYDRGLLPREKKKTLLGLVIVSSVFLGLGILLFGIGMFE